MFTFPVTRLAVVAFAFSSAIVCATPCDAQTWWNTSWAQRKQIVFNNLEGTEDLTNFPVLVILDGTRIDYSQTQDAGQDIRFVDGNGRKTIQHEIERWDEAGLSYVWVKVPEIDKLSDIDSIWLYYGNATAPDAQDVTAVWSNGYNMVHHLEETSGAHTDSTSNKNDGAANDSTPGAAGIIGRAASFNGKSGFIQVPHTGSLSDTGTLSLSAWICPSDRGQSGLRCALSKGATANKLNYWLGVSDREAAFRFYDKTFYQQSTSGLSMQPGGWYHIAVTYANGTDAVKIYVNGALFHDGVEKGVANSNNEALYLGKSQFGEFFSGSLDEVRLEEPERSAAWIMAQYRSMSDALIDWSAGDDAMTPPTLWGIAHNDGHLFSLENYNKPSTSATLYGQLYYESGKGKSTIGDGIESLAVNVNHRAYFVINKAIGEFSSPVLATFDLLGASTKDANLVTLVGSVATSGQAIQGLAFHPKTGDLYALTSEALYVVDRAAGGASLVAKSLTGAGQAVSQGSDLAFNKDGSALYVIDQADDHLYECDPATGEILATRDLDTTVFASGDRGLAWDSVNTKLVAANTLSNALNWLTISDGNNPVLGSLANVGLSDVRAITFPSSTGGSAASGVQILRWQEVR